MATPVQQNLNPLDFSKNENTRPQLPLKAFSSSISSQNAPLGWHSALWSGLNFSSWGTKPTSFASAETCRASRNKSPEPRSNFSVLRGLWGGTIPVVQRGSPCETNSLCLKLSQRCLGRRMLLPEAASRAQLMLDSWMGRWNLVRSHKVRHTLPSINSFCMSF